MQYLTHWRMQMAEPRLQANRRRLTRRVARAAVMSPH